MALWLVRSAQVVRVRALAWGHCVVFLGDTFYSQSVSPRPGVEMATGAFSAGEG